MKGHEEFERLLATYRDASIEDRRTVDAHLAACPSCAARLERFDELDRVLHAAAEPALPPRLARPFAAVVSSGERMSPPGGAGAFRFPSGVAPTAIVLLLLVALSVIFWSVNTGSGPVTSTPTLTTTLTLTPTMNAVRGTGPATLSAMAASVRPAPAPAFVPTPAPAPVAPAPILADGNSAILFAGSRAHATILH